MRVTNTMMADNFLNDMMNNLENLQTLNMQMTSGKEIRRPSDDPFKVARAMQLHTDINSNKQYNENIKDTINWLEQTDTTLNQAGNQFQRMRELLVSAGNAVYGSSERKKIKDEINEIIGQLSQTLNSAFDGKYLFSGTRGTTKPTETIKGPAVTEIKPQISPDEKLPAEASINGKYTGVENVDFEVTVVGSDIAVKANGKQIPVKKDPKGNSWDLGNGLTFEINKDQKLVDGSGYKFTAVADGNTRLMFNGKTENEVNDEKPLTAKISNGNIKDWKDKNITFNVNGEEVKVELKDLELKDVKDVGKIIEKINSNEKLKGKILACEVKNGEESSIEFYSLDNNKAFIKEKGTDVEALKNETKKFMGSYEIKTMGERLVTEISQGVNIEYNVTATDIIKFNDEKGNERNLTDILENIVRHLDSPDGSKDIKEITNSDLEAVDAVMNNVLKIRSQVGAKQNRMESAENRNTEENFNMTEILSKTEDIDFTQKTMELAVASTVYTASLQTSARIIQPTLLDYLR